MQEQYREESQNTKQYCIVWNKRKKSFLGACFVPWFTCGLDIISFLYDAGVDININLITDSEKYTPPLASGVLSTLSFSRKNLLWPWTTPLPPTALTSTTFANNIVIPSRSNERISYKLDSCMHGTDNGETERPKIPDDERGLHSATHWKPAMPNFKARTYTWPTSNKIVNSCTETARFRLLPPADLLAGWPASRHSIGEHGVCPSWLCSDQCWH